MQKIILALLAALSSGAAIAQTQLGPGTYSLPTGTTVTVPATPIPTPIPTPTPCVPSPNGSTLTGPTGTLVDASCNIWSLTSGQTINENGAPAGVSANVTVLAYVAGAIWQENAAGGWWYWNGNTWIGGPDPLPTPTPTPTPAAGAFQVLGGVTDVFNTLPDTIFTGFHIWNGMNCIYSGDSFAIYPANWGSLDSLYSWTRANNLKFIWYGGFIGSYGGSFPSGATAAQYNSFLGAVHSRAPNIEYVNYANEAISNPVNHSGEPFYSMYGGAGATGWDWLINLGKATRAAFPNAKIGINDFNVESAGNDLSYGAYGSSATRLAAVLPVYQLLKANGVLDFIGFEGYSLETVSDANLLSALNQAGAIAPVIYTEFSPYANAGAGIAPAAVSAAWQRLLPEIVNSGKCQGVFGPWDYRWSNTQNGGIGGSQYFYDDRTGTTEPVVIWLQGYTPGLGLHGGPWQ